MSDGTVVGHAYDPDGNRVKTTVAPVGGGAPVATSFLVDTSGGLSQVVADTDGSGNITALYVRNRDELLEVMRPGAGGTWTTRYVHSDGLGSVRLLTDETGTTVETRGYEAFGTKNTEAGNDALSYGFAGEPFEGTTKLAYHRARWMDARVGRFDGMDLEDGSPLRPLSQHRYLYAGDDPQDKVDPTGREYDMASISAGLEGSLVLSTIATVSLATIAADVECTIAENISGVAINPSKCPRIQHFFNYESQDTYENVVASGVILSPNLGLVFLTNDIYLSGEEAWNRLAVQYRPVGYWDIPSSSITFLAFGGPVLPAVDAFDTVRPGGANEWYTNPPVPIYESHWVPIGP